MIGKLISIVLFMLLLYFRKDCLVKQLFINQSLRVNSHSFRDIYKK